MYACEREESLENHLEVVRVIVDCGANVWYTNKVWQGTAPLFISFDVCTQPRICYVLYSTSWSIDVILSVSFKVNGGPGLNAVHIACIKGNLEALKLLLNIQLLDTITVKKHLNTGTRKVTTLDLSRNDIQSSNLIG